MNKEKWEENVGKEMEKLEDAAGEFDGPENWPAVKKELKEFIKNVDELTEVYNEEKGKV